MGVPEHRISSGAPCTFCARQEFDSYRRDGDLAGRMISAIGVRSL
jgi:copper oxidase (laccase) domain-containing protein